MEDFRNLGQTLACLAQAEDVSPTNNDKFTDGLAQARRALGKYCAEELTAEGET